MRIIFQALQLRVGGCVVAAALLALTVAMIDPASAAASTRQVFATPQAAVEALVAAVRAGDEHRIASVLGPGSGPLVRSGDPVADEQGRLRFVADYDRQSKIEMRGEDKAALLIGEKEWPLPIPLVKDGAGWRFDSAAGAKELLERRIGRNELAAIQVCLAYVDAQRDYAATAGNVRGLHEYASKFSSARGRHDGLYWPTLEGERPSPLGALVADAHTEGYYKQPYHGYFYRIITAQGPNASGGEYDYRVRGRLVGGFALVAYPARWESSGVMTFIVNHDGIVYEKNLGADTAALASGMKRFDPDPSWSKVRP